jgi:hypothetical protein
MHRRGCRRAAGDDPTLLLALDLARRCGAKLHLVHVAPCSVLAIQPMSEAATVAPSLAGGSASVAAGFPGGVEPIHSPSCL